jgi:hypothetical protein
MSLRKNICEKYCHKNHGIFITQIQVELPEGVEVVEIKKEEDGVYCSVLEKFLPVRCEPPEGCPYALEHIIGRKK